MRCAALLPVLAPALAACGSMQRAEDSATDYCRKRGKQAEVLEREREDNGSALVRVACYDPAQLVRIPGPFGLNALSNADVSGATVFSVLPDSIASRTGLGHADIIREFDGHAIASAEDLRQAVANVPSGKLVTIRLHRNQREFALSAQF